MAVVAGFVARVLDRDARTVARLLAGELDLYDHVRADRGVVGGGAAAALRGKAAHAAERKTKAPKAGVAAGVPARGGCGTACGGKRVARAHGVVPGTLLLIGEDSVGLGDLLEALLGIRFLVHVGMQLAGLLLERLLDVLGRGVLIHAEDGVVVFIVHSCHMAKNSLLRLYSVGDIISR